MKFRVNLKIDQITVEADNAEAAISKALEMVIDNTPEFVSGAATEIRR